VISPTHPFTYFLTNTPKQLPVNWIGETEYNGRDERLNRYFDRVKPVVIFNRRPHIDQYTDPYPLCEKLADLYRLRSKWFMQKYGTNGAQFLPKLMERFKLIDSGKYFCVFVHPELGQYAGDNE